MIETLIDKGLAYVGGNGDVFYSVSKFKTYGKLSGKNLADLQAGERVDVDLAKQDPFDFVLWKMAKADEPSWDSPWGQGRPGWHIECSAMSTCCLGNHFDIHGGGMDLQFPHHENEIAQSEGATGETFVNVWMHNGFVRVDNEKMSKSLGNFFTVREVLNHYRTRYGGCAGEIVRFFILNSHYRSPLNYSDEQLYDACIKLKKLYTAINIDLNDEDRIPIFEEYLLRFERAMNDDFNTPIAISVLFDVVKEINKFHNSLLENFNKKENLTVESGRLDRLVVTLKYLGRLLGILQNAPVTFLQGEIQDEMIETQIFERVIAKQSKDWTRADQIRDDLKQQGIILEDNPDGSTSWQRETKGMH
jgi:cysteinyl-tRNA synthetase